MESGLVSVREERQQMWMECSGIKQWWPLPMAVTTLTHRMTYLEKRKLTR